MPHTSDMAKRWRIDSRVRLANGVEMPILGLGVFRSGPGRETREAVEYALSIGYRSVDTARVYGNERDVGQALAASGIPRADLFVTTKLWNSDHGYDAALRAFDESLADLRLDYVDLYLVHWPVERLRHESWRALERIASVGRARAVGVSNYTIRHLEELLSRSRTPPAVDQVEFHPFLYQAELLAFCRSRGIQLEAYSPLTKGRRLDDPAVRDVAVRHRKTPAQVLIRWCIEHEVVAIPKSVHLERIRENAQVFDFELSPAEVRALDALDEGWRTSWDPTDVP
jgi:diketogulonate reductase-like aldo/keto reductase